MYIRRWSSTDPNQLFVFLVIVISFRHRQPKRYHCYQNVITEVTKVATVPHGFSLTTYLMPILAACLETSLPR